MIRIKVQRGFGVRQGPDVVDALLATEPAALARGTKEIDASTSVFVISLRVEFRPDVNLGTLVEVHDALQSSVWRGRIVGITHSYNLPILWTDLDIERPV